MLKPINKIIKPYSVTDSPIEEKLYEGFCEYGLKPIPQYIEASFRIDLAFPEISLAIEADGKEFHSTEIQKKRDEYKDKRLKDMGWKIERFTGSFIHKHGDVAVAKIVLKYFENKISREDNLKARGRLASYFYRPNTIHYDIDLAKRITDEFLEEEVLRNKKIIE